MAEPVRYPMPAAIAAMAIDRHHVVEASAGTGKTYLIEHRIVDLVVRGAVPIESILVVTFTEKATAELERRIRELLVRVAGCREHGAAPDEPHWRIDGAARARLEAAILSFDRATIATIHGFCHRVLADNAFAGGRLFDESQIPAEAAFAEAFTACLREDFSVDDTRRPLLEAWLGADRTVGTLRKLLWGCVQKGGRIAPPFDAGDCARLLGGAAEALGDPAAALTASYPNARTRKAIASRLARLHEVAAAHRQGGDLGQALVALDQLARSKGGKFWSYFDDHPPASDEARHLLEVAGALRGIGLDAAVACLFLPPLLARLRGDKRRRGLFDFGDMLSLVWEALEGEAGPRLAARLRGRYRHALIDEFQDTDPVQWSIFRRLYLEHEGGRLSIIGDPKQAIYGFRGADLHTYLRARREVQEAGGQRTSLTVNHRSTPALVAAYNHLLTADGPFFTGGVDYDEPVTAGKETRLVDAGGAEVAPVVLWRPSGEVSASALQEAVVRRVCDEIAALLGDRTLRLGTPGAERPLSAADVYVLTRTVREANDVADALRARGLPCALYKQEGLLQSPEAADVRDLLSAIASPRSPAARLRAWQTRFFDTPLAELGRLSDLDDDDPLVVRLHDWHQLAARLDYEQLFARVLDESRLVERELALSPSERALTNFLHLFELLLEEIARDRCEVHELAQRLQRWIDDLDGLDAAERNVQRLESDDEAVQIMTVHKAKGLEAGVVFLAGGLGSFPSGPIKSVHDGDERLAWIGTPPPAIAGAIERELRGEDERLLYVGLTRAVGRLYLPCPDPEEGGVRGYYRLLAERLSPALAARHPALFAVEDLPVDGAPPADPAAARLDDWSPALAAAPPARDLAAEAARRAGVDITSYSRLAADHGATVVADADAEVDADVSEATAPPAEDDGLPGGREVGVFLHDLLERLPLAAARDAADLDAFAADPAVAALADDCLGRHGVDPSHRAESLALVYDAVTRPVDLGGGVTLGGVAGVERERRELEFLYPVAGADGDERLLVKGFIDLVFEHEGRVYVLDWKSDRLGDYGPDALAGHVAAHYQTQARLYATAIDRLLGGDAAGYEERFGGVVFAFLRGRASHALRPARAELEAFTRTLAEGGQP